MKNEVIEWLATKVDMDPKEIEADMAIAELGITSLKMLEYIVDFEIHFDIKVSDREMNNIYTVQDLIDLLDGK